MENKNMTICKACKKEIAKGAKVCPNCGKDQRNFFMRHKIVSILGAFVVLGIIGNLTGTNNNTTVDNSSTKVVSHQTENTINNNDNKKKEEKQETAINVDLKSMLKTYEDNEAKGDKEYKDKTVIVTGKIDRISTTFGDTAVILDGEKDSILNLYCYVNEKDLDKVTELKKGQTVTIQGKVTGKTMDVSMNNCILK